MLVTLLPIVMLVRAVQEPNTPCPIVVTLFPPVTLLRFEQPLNAQFEMLITLSGIAIVVRLVKPENAFSPIVVTLLGIVTLVIEFLDEKKGGGQVPSPILVTVYPPRTLGIITAPPDPV
jgi:hypothetical protein